jgi:hypothetical protein
MMKMKLMKRNKTLLTFVKHGKTYPMKIHLKFLKVFKKYRLQRLQRLQTQKALRYKGLFSVFC